MESSPYRKRRKLQDTDLQVLTESSSAEIQDDCETCTWSSLQETDVGILEYMSANNTPIRGILKQRYCDFLVSERNMTGDLVKLSSLELPMEDATNTNEGPRSGDFPGNYTDLSDEIRQLISEANFSAIRSLASKQGCTDPILLQSNSDKESRKTTHKFLKENFANLDSDTVSTTNGEKAVRIFPKVRKPNDNIRKQKSYSWPESCPHYCHFTLYKENKDTMEAVNLISKFLHVKPSLFSYGGTKDRRAITVQRLCAYMISARKLLALNSRLRNICIGNCEYMDHPMQLGSLSGNHFRVVLRDVRNSNEEIFDSMESFVSKGFINYFGMQRFGTGCSPTHVIGRSLLCSKWKEAVDHILTPNINGTDFQQSAKECWMKTKDPKQCSSLLTNRRCLESYLLQGLIKFGCGNYLNAIQQIPRNTRLMYVHAYQSYIWNTIVSRRIKELGFCPLTGDLVEEEKVAACESQEISPKEMGKKPGSEWAKRKVKVLTEDDIASQRYTVFDIIMPLPGYDVTYPSNVVKEWYKELMALDGIDIDNMRHKVKDFSLSGAYRNIAVKPDHLSWSVVQYDDYTIPLFPTDMQLLNSEWKEPSSLGKLTALRLEFTLPPSCYATMAIRELTRMDSSAHSQALLNNVESSENAVIS